MANYKIITNNPMALEKYPYATYYRAGTVKEIFTACRDAVHRGAVLISHPLSSSVKPGVNPYKSVVISAAMATVDFRSLQLIEDSIATLEKLGLAKREFFDNRVLEDCQVVDLDLLDSAMQSLPPVYY